MVQWIQLFPSVLGNLWLEAAVVGAVCSVFLVLFVLAGVREIIRNKD